MIVTSTYHQFWQPGNLEQEYVLQKSKGVGREVEVREVEVGEVEVREVEVREVEVREVEVREVWHELKYTGRGRSQWR